MKKQCLNILLSFVFLMSVSSIGVSQQLLDKVVAVVNSHVITQSQVTQQMHIMQSQLAANGEPSLSAAVLRQKVIDELINHALEMDIAQKANMKVTDEELNQTIQKIAAQNNTSVAQMLKVINAHGLSEKAYRDQIRQQMLIHKIEEKMVSPQVTLTKEDVIKANKMPKPSAERMKTIANAHAQYHVIDLLFSSKSSAENALVALSKMNVTGKTVDQVKKMFADQHASGLTINDMGYRSLAMFPNVFVKAVSRLSPAQFSEVVQAPNGFHILFLASVSGKNQAVQNPAYLSPEQIAFQNKYNEERQNWLRKLRNQSYVKVLG